MEQRPRDEDPLLLTAGELAYVAITESPRPRRSRTVSASVRSSGLIRGERRVRERVITMTSRTVTGKFQSTDSTWGTYDIRSPGFFVTCPLTGLMVPRMARKSVVLPDPDGPTTPTKSPWRISKFTFEIARFWS